MAEGEVGGASATAPAAAKVRVVRCPKCQKLLPELAGFTVYRCGGCDTTLQAKHAIPVTDTSSSEKSDEERVAMSENPECCSGNKRPGSENDLESDKFEFRRQQRVGAGNSNGSTSSTSGSRGGYKVPDEPSLDDLRSGSQHRDGRYPSSSKAPAVISNGGADEMVKANVEDETQNKLQGDRTYRSQKVQNNPIYKDEEKDGLGVLRRTPRTLLEGGRFSPYSHEGPSSSRPISSFGYRDDGHVRHQNTDRSESVATLEQDRAHLLKKLDELRDQLSRSCDIRGKSNERDPVNRTASSNLYGRHSQGTWFENSSSMNRTSTRHFPMYDGNNVDMQNFYSAPHVQNEVLGYGDQFESQQLRRAPYHTPHQYPQRATESYMYGQFDPDPVISYPHNVFYHQPACSCPHCCNMHWQASVQDAQPVFPNQRAPYLANSHGLPLGNPFMVGSSNYNHRGTNGSLVSREPRMHQRSVLAKRSGHSCKPISGGAPFIVCNNCSELLQVPQKLSSVGKNLYKLRCGSCSQVISFKIEGKRLNISSPPTVMNTSLEPINNSADAIAQGLQCPGPSDHGLVDSYSGDYEGSSCHIQSTDEKLVLSSLPAASHETIEKEYGLNLSESENMLGLSSSPSPSEDNESTESMVCQREAPSSTELQPRTQGNSRGPGLPLREHFGYPSPDQAVNRPGEGSRSKRFEQEKMAATNSNFKQNSIKDVSTATEIDLATDKYPNPGLSQDSVEDSKEDHPQMSKGGDSFFTGLIKKSFRDFHRFNQSLDGSKTKVSINGHHIPDRLVKKAEKLAGPIYPGEYWYDYGAGFWGVMGQPCLGIIPPFIEEFNYPMPKNCAGGNTGVTVNGRELHQKDLDLLVGRGLPSDSGRSYRIDIAGRVVDEVSGEELDSLGKLAPTVEKLKRGFGLRAPRVLAG